MFYYSTELIKRKYRKILRHPHQNFKEELNVYIGDLYITYICSYLINQLG